MSKRTLREQGWLGKRGRGGGSVKRRGSGVEEEEEEEKRRGRGKRKEGGEVEVRKIKGVKFNK